jgi:hypothetical protein
MIIIKINHRYDKRLFEIKYRKYSYKKKELFYVNVAYDAIVVTPHIFPASLAKRK